MQSSVDMVYVELKKQTRIMEKQHLPRTETKEEDRKFEV